MNRRMRKEKDEGYQAVLANQDQAKPKLGEQIGLKMVFFVSNLY